MKRHDIRLRKQEFGANRIKQYKDYKQLMRQHHRASKTRNIINITVAIVVLVLITGMIYYTSSTVRKQGPIPERKKLGTEQITSKIYDFEELVVNVVGHRATPEIGMKAYGKYLQENLVYPQEAKEAGVVGIVNVQFLVNPDGSLSDFRVVNRLGYGCDEEAVRLIKEGPAWVPALVEGERKEGGMIVPVMFF